MMNIALNNSLGELSLLFKKPNSPESHININELIGLGGDNPVINLKVSNGELTKIELSNKNSSEKFVII